MNSNNTLPFPQNPIAIPTKQEYHAFVEAVLAKPDSILKLDESKYNIIDTNHFTLIKDLAMNSDGFAHMGSVIDFMYMSVGSKCSLPLVPVDIRFEMPEEAYQELERYILNNSRRYYDTMAQYARNHAMTFGHGVVDDKGALARVSHMHILNDSDIVLVPRDLAEYVGTNLPPTANVVEVDDSFVSVWSQGTEGVLVKVPKLKYVVDWNGTFRGQEEAMGISDVSAS